MISYLVSTLRDQGRLEEAEACAKEVLDLRIKYLGKEDRESIHAMTNLVGTYYEQGRYEEMEALQAEGLERSKCTIGPCHPDIILAMGGWRIAGCARTI